MDGTPDVLKPHKPLIRSRFKKGQQVPDNLPLGKTPEPTPEPKPEPEPTTETKAEPEPTTETTPKPGDTVITIGEGEPTGNETITITGRKYEIRYDNANRKRRADYFSGNKNKPLIVVVKYLIILCGRCC